MLCSFSAFWQDLDFVSGFRLLSLPLCGLLSQQNRFKDMLFSSCLLKLGLVFRPEFNDPFVSQNPREFNASYFQGLL